MACAMVFNASNKSHNHAPNQLIRSFERILEDAQISGDLNLSGKKLKEYPKVRKEYNLSDTVNAGKLLLKRCRYVIDGCRPVKLGNC